MAKVPPVFTMQESHFSDYGFDSQLDCFQDKEARNKQQSKRSESTRFKLSKLISKDIDRLKSKKRKWWENALGFLKRAKEDVRMSKVSESQGYFCNYRSTANAPVYVTESHTQGSTMCRSSSRVMSGPLPYVCLRELNVTEGNATSASGYTTNSMPIYLVT